MTDIDDLFRKLPAIAVLSVCDWLQFTEEPVDRHGNHQSRAVIWSKWKEVQATFQNVFMENGCQAPKQRTTRPDPARLVQQGLGCFMSAAGTSDFVANDIPEFCEWVRKQITPLLKQCGLKKLHRRVDEIQARAPVHFDRNDPFVFGSNQEAAGSEQAW